MVQRNFLAARQDRLISRSVLSREISKAPNSYKMAGAFANERATNGEKIDWNLISLRSKTPRFMNIRALESPTRPHESTGNIVIPIVFSTVLSRTLFRAMK